MNVLDENIIASQRRRLQSWRIRVRQIGVDIARIRHPQLNTQAKRMGTVVRVSHRGRLLWRLHASNESAIQWEDPATVEQR